MPLLITALLLQAAAPARAPRTFHVPRDLPTVQRAIDTAQRGDTVLVAPGRYFENLRFRGRDIVLASHFILERRDSAIISRTILDGSRPTHPDSGTVVTIYQFEDSTTVLEGFTITGGTGTVWYDNKDKIFFREGGGILIDLAGPTIRNNVITGNQATDIPEKSLSAGGGGIRVGFADPILESNVISRNKGRYGGGVVLFHSATRLTGNMIRENTGGEDFGGAGLWMYGYFAQRLNNLIERNVITDNVALGPDGKGKLKNPPADAGKGGGIRMGGANAILRDNVVKGNKPDDVRGKP
jgi:hypothetical protein